MEYGRLPFGHPAPAPEEVMPGSSRRGVLDQALGMVPHPFPPAAASQALPLMPPWSQPLGGQAQGGMSGALMPPMGQAPMPMPPTPMGQPPMGMPQMGMAPKPMGGMPMPQPGMRPFPGPRAY